jgi:hypothetical protein
MFQLMRGIALVAAAMTSKFAVLSIIALQVAAKEAQAGPMICSWGTNCARQKCQFMKSLRSVADSLACGTFQDALSFFQGSSLQPPKTVRKRSSTVIVWKTDK